MDPSSPRFWNVSVAALGVFFAGVLKRKADKNSLFRDFAPALQEFAAKKGKIGNGISIVSFNVLAQDYINHHRYCPPHATQWKTRMSGLFYYINLLDADILCLQEVDRYDYFEKRLKALGYESRFVSRTGMKNDGCVTAWKSDTFEFNGEIRIEFNDLSKNCKTETESAIYIRDNVGLGISLQPTAPNLPPLLVGNAHLYWNPIFDKVKLRQTVYLVHRLEEHMTDSTVLLLCGDFNSTPDSDVYKFLDSGFVGTKQSHVDTDENGRTKLLFGPQLKKICRWVRSVGVDAALFSDEGQYSEMFDQARREGRVIVTQSRSTIARKGCPAALLLKQRDPKGMVIEVRDFFDIKLVESQCFSRCVACNGILRDLEFDEVQTWPNIPDVMRKKAEHDFSRLQFVACTSPECHHPYWWGGRTAVEINKIREMFQLEIENNKDEEKKESDDGFEYRHLLPSVDTFYKKLVRFTHSLNLKSAYKIRNGEEPKFTNYTTTYQGTLDYIFVGSKQDCNFDCISDVLELPTKDDVLRTGEALPSTEWPSDHLAVATIINLEKIIN